jgi:hypothetical protein
MSISIGYQPNLVPPQKDERKIKVILEFYLTYAVGNNWD